MDWIAFFISAAIGAAIFGSAIWLSNYVYKQVRKEQDDDS